VITLPAIERDTVIIACAISAGIHAALTPNHFTEGAGAGLGFLGATALLIVLAAVLTQRQDAVHLVGAVAVFAGLIGSYLLATTSGFPLLHPDREPVDSLALVTKAIEVVALLATVHLLWHARPALAPQTDN
jgi:hypothetical protein